MTLPNGTPKCDYTSTNVNNQPLQCTDDAVGEAFFLKSDRHVEQEVHTRCHNHLPKATYDIAIRLYKIESPLSDQSHSSGRAEMSQPKKTKNNGKKGGQAKGRASEATKAVETAKNGGPSEGQLTILSTLSDLGGEKVTSIKIVEKLGGLEKFGPRGKVRAAMEKLEELGYVSRVKEGVKYSFSLTKPGQNFLATRAAAGTA